MKEYILKSLVLLFVKENHVISSEMEIINGLSVFKKNLNITNRDIGLAISALQKTKIICFKDVGGFRKNEGFVITEKGEDLLLGNELINFIIETNYVRSECRSSVPAYDAWPNGMD